MEKFEVITLRNLEGRFYIHCYSCPDIKSEEVLYEFIKSIHKPLSGDILLLNATFDIDRPDYMISISGNRRMWKLFNGESSLPGDIEKEGSDWYLPWVTESSFFFRKPTQILRGLAITKPSISESYEFLAHKTHCTIIKHTVL
jgi:hypothetical protein